MSALHGRTTVLALSLTAIGLCVDWGRGGNDSDIIKWIDPLNTPLHLYPDSLIIDRYRALGYVLTSKSLAVREELLCNFAGDSRSPTFAYLHAQYLYDAELVDEAFPGHARPRPFPIDLRDETVRRILWSTRERVNECQVRLRKGKDRSPEIARILESCITDLEGANLKDCTPGYLETLADYYYAVEEDSTALAYLEQALQSYLANGNYIVASAVAGRIGEHHMRKGNGLRAEQAMLDCIRYAHLGEDPFQIARGYAFLAGLRTTQGRFIEAEALLTQAIVHSRRIMNPISQVARLIDLAYLSLTLGESSRALELCEEGLSLDEKCLKEPSLTQNALTMNSVLFYRAQAYSIKAEIYLERGKADAAVAAISEALAISEKTLDSRFEAALESKLGSALHAAGRDEEALQSLKKALTTSRKLGEKDKEVEYLTTIGDLYLDRKDYPRAEEHLEQALNAIESDPSAKRVVPVLSRLARVRAGRHDYRSAAELHRKSIARFERERAEKNFAWNRHALRDEIERVFCDHLVLESNHLCEVDSLLFYAEKSRLLRQGGGRNDGCDLNQRIENSVSNTSWIPENAVVVQHIVTPDTTIVIATDTYGSTYRSIPVSRGRLDDEVRRFVDGCMALETMESTAPREGYYRAIEERARSLYLLLLEPVAAILGSKEVLCFISDEPLRRLPFGALIAPSDQPRFLIEDKKIVSGRSFVALSSGGSAQLGTGSARAFPSKLLIGQPELNGAMQVRYPSLTAIPQSRREVAEIDSILGNCTVITGAQATKNEIREHSANAGLIHVATHAVFSASGQHESALVLSPDPTNGSEEITDSWLLRESDIQSMDLSGTRLVVLSTCQSAARRRADELNELGIAGAFLDAGARSVVATLWPVEDRSARLFMRAFYRDLLKGEGDAGAALQSAQRSFIRENRVTGNPFKEIHIWVPFLCFGSF